MLILGQELAHGVIDDWTHLFKVIISVIDFKLSSGKFATGIFKNPVLIKVQNAKNDAAHLYVKLLFRLGAQTYHPHQMTVIFKDLCIEN